MFCFKDIDHQNGNDVFFMFLIDEYYSSINFNMRLIINFIKIYLMFLKENSFL